MKDDDVIKCLVHDQPLEDENGYHGWCPDCAADFDSDLEPIVVSQGWKDAVVIEGIRHSENKSYDMAHEDCCDDCEKRALALERTLKHFGLPRYSGGPATVYPGTDEFERAQRIRRECDHLYQHAECADHPGEIEYPDSGCAKCRAELEVEHARAEDEGM